MLGIENLKKAALLLIHFGQKVESTSKDGFQFTDLFQFVGELAQVPDIISNKDAIVAEFKDLTAEERAELNAFVEANLTLENKKTEKIIEAAFGLLISLLTLVESLKPEAAAEAPLTEPSVTQ